jgi:hypothetical protein
VTQTDCKDGILNMNMWLLDLIARKDYNAVGAKRFPVVGNQQKSLSELMNFFVFEQSLQSTVL